jgi:hypothetical protein
VRPPLVYCGAKVVWSNRPFPDEGLLDIFGEVG